MGLMPTRSISAPKRLPGSGDPVYLATDAIGDAWSWLVLREAVLEGVTRFNAFQSRLGIARETLAGRLDHLAAGGLIERDGPDYRLTPCGKDLFGCLVAAMHWGDCWCGGEGPTESEMTHRGCGCRFKPVFRCSACRKPLGPRDVVVDAVAQTSTELIGGQRHRAPGLDLLQRVRPCSIARTLRVCGDRWSSLVIRECFMRTRRFDDFARRLGIAPNILAQRLNRLVDLGMLARQPYQFRPLRYEYRLTEMGLDYYPIPLAMLTWAQHWLRDAKRGIVLRHRLCGQHFTAILTCEHCAAPVSRDDIDVQTKCGPAALANKEALAKNDDVAGRVGEHPHASENSGTTCIDDTGSGR
jgi:DNA-binding HxlR family transcriptional regulator